MSSESSRNTPEKNEHPYAHTHAGLAMPAMASPSPGGSPWRYRSGTGARPQFQSGESPLGLMLIELLIIELS